MNSRNWVKFFLRTLLLGGIVTVITGIFVSFEEYKGYIANLEFLEILVAVAWLFVLGLLFSVISQMGFLAYLMIHRLGLELFRSLWNGVQFVLIAFVFFDLIYFRYRAFAEPGDSVLPYFLIALFILLIGIVVAYVKSQQSNKKAFIPALFFMMVITTIEWVPVLQHNDPNWLHLMLYPLLICNTYQLLTLQKYNLRSQQERIAKQETKAITQ
ncbi:KinB-signaling pathway activation protein [Bacillus kwashiorkori]|uniref:KinB-signaling pathway activation protein n=1 Tax=Bacillus kwashiorkori TaxID=1522318 RepID=UPI00078623DD|nr:KinB-signaling pathway activation protein [Bacillus kwashiorkori]